MNNKNQIILEVEEKKREENLRELSGGISGWSRALKRAAGLLLNKKISKSDVKKVGEKTMKAGFLEIRIWRKL